MVALQQGLARAGIAGQVARPGHSPDQSRHDPRGRCSHRRASKDVGGLAVREDRFEEHVKRCDGALRVPEVDVDVVAGIGSAQAWIHKRVFESFEDSPAGHIAKLAGMLAPLAPGFVVSPDALHDCGVRPTKAEWSRFVGACDLVRPVDAESA
ncbi:MAG: hypothetical protein QOG79_7665 [Mycobacterium sp.]|nr:hypothetical protein [Mycobacterium sp.]